MLFIVFGCQLFLPLAMVLSLFLHEFVKKKESIKPQKLLSTCCMNVEFKRGLNASYFP